MGSEITNGDPLAGHDVDCKVRSKTEIYVRTYKRMAAQSVSKGELKPTDARIKMHNRMTTDCASNDIIEDEARALWNDTSIKSLLRKTKAKRLPTVEDILEVPQGFKTTTTDQRFQLEMKSDNTIVFVDDRGLDLLRRSPVWKLDGTYKSAPKGYQQVYTIHCRHPNINESIAVVHALMIKKRKRCYKELFEALRNVLGAEELTEFTPAGVRRMALFDFESGAYRAFQAVFPEFKVKGCRFHFGQRILRHFDKHLKTLKNENEEVAIWLKQILGLPLLPEELIPGVWQSLGIPPDVEDQSTRKYLKKFVKYVSKNWINSSLRPISLWNHFDNNMCRTTNSAEGWHSGILNAYNIS